MNEEKKRILRSFLSKTMLGRSLMYKRLLWRWKKKFPHNKTIPTRMVSIDLVDIGKGTYGKICVYSLNKQSKLIIGHYCSIADNVTFLLGVEHPLNHIMTYPFKSMYNNVPEATSKGNIVIEDDVWVGFGVTILSGITIGKGAVVAAGAVVTKDIPPYAIAAGVPAEVIRYRFDEDVIRKLINVDFSILQEKTISDKIKELYDTVTKDNIDKLIESIFCNI